MQMFITGVIFEDKCIVTGDFDRIRKEYKTKKPYINVELIPLFDDKEIQNSDEKDWMFTVNENSIPDWFKNGREKYEQEFRKEASKWKKKHVLKNKKVAVLKNGSYYLDNCQIESISKNAVAYLKNCTVDKVEENAVILMMCENSVINTVCGNAIINNMEDNSIVKRISEMAIIRNMWRFSSVWEARNGATIQAMSGHSLVKFLENATIERMFAFSIVQKTYGKSVVDMMVDHAGILDVNSETKINDIDEFSSVVDIDKQKVYMNEKCIMKIKKANKY